MDTMDTQETYYKETYRVLRPLNLDGYGAVSPGDPETVELPIRQGAPLVSTGVLALVTGAVETPIREEDAS